MKCRPGKIVYVIPIGWARAYKTFEASLILRKLTVCLANKKKTLHT